MKANNGQWVVTITSRTINDYYGTDMTPEVITHVEKRDSFGALHMWILDWFKTTGAFRKMRKNELGVEYQPKEYAVADGLCQGINWYRNEPFDAPQFSEESWKDFLGRWVQSQVSEMIYMSDKYSGGKLSESDKTIQYGYRIANIYGKRRTWVQAYIKYVNADAHDWV